MCLTHVNSQNPHTIPRDNYYYYITSVDKKKMRLKKGNYLPKVIQAAKDRAGFQAYICLTPNVSP